MQKKNQQKKIIDIHSTFFTTTFNIFDHFLYNIEYLLLIQINKYIYIEL